MNPPLDLHLCVVQGQMGRFGRHRVINLDAAIMEADALHRATKRHAAVIDTRNGKTCYSTLEGHSSYIPKAQLDT